MLFTGGKQWWAIAGDIPPGITPLPIQAIHGTYHAASGGDSNNGVPGGDFIAECCGNDIRANART